MREQDRGQAVTLIGSDRAVKTAEVHFVCLPAEYQVPGMGLVLRICRDTALHGKMAQ